MTQQNSLTVRISVIIGMFILVSFLQSCTSSTTDQPVTDIDSVMTDTLKKELQADTVVINEVPQKIYALTQEDKTILELLQKVEMGYSFNEVKSKYDAVKGIRPEDKKDELASAGLTESVCKQSLFGGEAIAEFNFKDDSLYSYFFTYSEKDSEKAEQVFNAVKKYYNTQLGEAQLEMVEEENHYNRNFVWPSQKTIVPYLNFNLNTNTISWGKRYDRAL
jgi:hypothetical protein